MSAPCAWVTWGLFCCVHGASAQSPAAAHPRRHHRCYTCFCSSKSVSGSELFSQIRSSNSFPNFSDIFRSLLMWFRQAEQDESPALLCSWQTGGCRWQDRFSNFTSAVTSSDTVNHPEQSVREFHTRQPSIAWTWSESGCRWIEEDGKVTPMYGWWNNVPQAWGEFTSIINRVILLLTAPRASH